MTVWQTLGLWKTISTVLSRFKVILFLLAQFMMWAISCSTDVLEFWGDKGVASSAYFMRKFKISSGLRSSANIIKRVGPIPEPCMIDLFIVVLGSVSSVLAKRLAWKNVSEINYFALSGTQNLPSELKFSWCERMWSIASVLMCDNNCCRCIVTAAVHVIAMFLSLYIFIITAYISCASFARDLFLFFFVKWTLAFLPRDAMLARY